MRKPNLSSIPFFPNFHIQTLSGKRRSQQQIFAENLEKLRRNSFDHLHRMLKGFLPDTLFKDSPGGRNRIYTKTNTFWAFLGQVLDGDGSCQAAVHRVREQAQQQGAPVTPSVNTAAFVKSRKRLETSELSSLFYHGSGAVEEEMPRKYRRALVAIDGTTFTMPDTESNQARWPQSKEQQEGLGFPMMKMVGAFSVDSRALLDFETGNKHDHEITLLRNMIDSLQPEDILVMDRAYCSYCDLVDFQRKGMDVVVRNHQARKEIPSPEAFRIVSADDRWVVWKKPQKRLEHLEESEWIAVPETLKVRQITLRVEIPGFRSQEVVLITTLHENEYSTDEVTDMYRDRWLAEISFRDLKQTLNADELRCKSAEMIEKELWMRLIGYNALCYLLKEASLHSSTPRELLSFKGALQVMRAWEHRFRDWRISLAGLLRSLYENLAEALIIPRPNRVEPRANKRRPKIIRLMTKPRRVLLRELLQKFGGSKPLVCPLS